MNSQPRTVCISADQADFGYGDPEVHYCTEPATHRGWEYRLPYPVPGGRERVHFCERHAAIAVAADHPFTGGIRLYRYRTVTK
jgi:hypothetical protein